VAIEPGRAAPVSRHIRSRRGSVGTDLVTPISIRLTPILPVFDKFPGFFGYSAQENIGMDDANSDQHA
jgi:hypothetical protein